MVICTVIGSGFLGLKIIGELARHAHIVNVYDSSNNQTNQVYLSVEEEHVYLVNRGLVEDRGFSGKIQCCQHLKDAVRNSKFIFECIPDILDIKQNVFRDISQFCPADAIIASSTLNLDIDEIAQKCRHPERVAGIRFLVPVSNIPEVEVMRGSCTSSKVMDRIDRFVTEMGKFIYYRVNDNPLILTVDQVESRMLAARISLSKKLGQSYKFPTLLSQSALNSLCGRCHQAEVNCLLCPCYHLSCVQCAKILMNRSIGCTTCKQVIIELVRF